MSVCQHSEGWGGSLISSRLAWATYQQCLKKGEEKRRKKRRTKKGEEIEGKEEVEEEEKKKKVAKMRMAKKTKGRKEELGNSGARL